MDLDLSRVKSVLTILDNPCKRIPAIQVVGTNGKGSICSFIRTCLASTNIKTGIYTSPHLISWRERICIDNEFIPFSDLRKELLALKSYERSYSLTPFELITVTAFKYFSLHKVDLMVLEVGLGGRLDATTAHPLRPIIAMGAIGLDHSEVLGSSLKSITKEKAGVISKGCMVISAPQHPEVAEILEQVASIKEANIKWVEPLREEWKLGLKGKFQKDNAAVAKAALEALNIFGWEIQEQNIRKGLFDTKWPGRLHELTWKDHPVLVDTAHNPQAAGKLASERESWPFNTRGVSWILGIQRQKDAPSMIRRLLKPTDQAWIVPIPDHSSWDLIEILELCPELSKQLFQEDDVVKVLSKLLDGKAWPTPSPVIAGSIYLIGHLLSEKIIS